MNKENMSKIPSIVSKGNKNLEKSMPQIAPPSNVEEILATTDERSKTQIMSQNNLFQSVCSPGDSRDSTGGTKVRWFNQTQMAMKLYEQRNRSCQSQLTQPPQQISQRKGGSLNRNQQLPKQSKLNTTQVLNT